MSHYIKKTFAFLVSAFLIIFTSGCQAETITTHPIVTTTDTTTFAKGADISWLPQMEATGYVFYNDNGVAEDCFKILKDHGINSIRLRTWVNPSDDRSTGHCSKEETVAMAVRAKQWGMRVMIDFHYSDTWADPGKQVKPKAWAGLTFDQLLKALYDYTFDVMTALKTAGITPEWVQVGNETPSGMLLPEGSTDNWSQLAKLINKGYDAIKAVSPTSKVILHVDQGNNNARFRWWFDAAKANGTKYDVIGMSYYPYWLSDSHPDYTLSINDLAANLKDMASRYGKEVMVVEVGGEDAKVQNTYDMLVAVLQKTKAVPNNKGTGVFYWEPQGARSWSHYALSCWGSDGRPTNALDAFLTPTALSESYESSLNIKFNKQSNTLVFNEILASIEIIQNNGVSVIKTANSDSVSVSNLLNGVYIIRAKSYNTNTPSVFKLIL